MKKSTPAKHRTPNYKLITKYGISRWEAQPLRATRKDLIP